jgi:hypothetical protein
MKAGYQVSGTPQGNFLDQFGASGRWLAGEGFVPYESQEEADETMGQTPSKPSDFKQKQESEVVNSSSPVTFEDYVKALQEGGVFDEKDDPSDYTLKQLIALWEDLNEAQEEEKQVQDKAKVSRSSKQWYINALTDMGVPFDAELSMGQLKELHQAEMDKLEQSRIPA